MSYYKCKCGTAHGNVHTPWNENKCPVCSLYPEFMVSGVKIQVAMSFGKWYVNEVKSDGSYTSLMSCMTKLPTYEEIEAQVKMTKERGGCEPGFYYGPSLNNNSVDGRICREGSQVNHSGLDPMTTLNHGICDENEWGVKYSDYIKPTPEEAAAGITGWIVREPVDVDEVVLSREAAQSFISMTGGTGPIFPYGDMPSVQMVPESECETKSHCTCDTFLLMQSGCKCGFFELEKEALK